MSRTVSFLDYRAISKFREEHPDENILYTSDKNAYTSTPKTSYASFSILFTPEFATFCMDNYNYRVTNTPWNTIAFPGHLKFTYTSKEGHKEGRYPSKVRLVLTKESDMGVIEVLKILQEETERVIREKNFPEFKDYLNGRKLFTPPYTDENNIKNSLIPHGETSFYRGPNDYVNLPSVRIDILKTAKENRVYTFKGKDPVEVKKGAPVPCSTSFKYEDENGNALLTFSDFHLCEPGTMPEKFYKLTNCVRGYVFLNYISAHTSALGVGMKLQVAMFKSSGKLKIYNKPLEISRDIALKANLFDKDDDDLPAEFEGSLTLPSESDDEDDKDSESDGSESLEETGSDA